MSKPLLSPQGEFPAVGLGRRLAAMFYDFLLCTALLIVTAFVYKLIWIAFVGEAKMRTLTESGALDGDPLLSTILLFVLFGFFAKFWTHSGQTLGMQVCGRRCCALWCRLRRGCAWAWGLSGRWLISANAAGMTSTPTASWFASPNRKSNDSGVAGQFQAGSLSEIKHALERAHGLRDH